MIIFRMRQLVPIITLAWVGMVQMGCTKLSGSEARKDEADTGDCAWYEGASKAASYKAIKQTFPHPKDHEFYIAVLEGDKKKAEQLLHSGANLECQGWHHMTPATYAAMNHDAQTLKMLLDLGANPNAQDTDGDSPMSLAAGNKNDSSLLEKLIQHGGNVNLEKPKKETPLFDAYLSLANTKLLVEAGANVNAKDWFNHTPLMNASPHFKVVYYLLEHGADPKAKDNHGMSVLYTIQSSHVAADDTERIADREKVINWLKERNLWHIEEPVWQPGYKKSHPHVNDP